MNHAQPPHVTVLGPFPGKDAGTLLGDAENPVLKGMPHEGGSPLASLVGHAVKEGRHRSVLSVSRAYQGEAQTFRGDRFTFHLAPRPLRHEVRCLYRQARRQVVDGLRVLQPDLVHANWTYFYALGALDSGYPMLLTVHDHAAHVLRHAGIGYLGDYLLTQRVLKRSPFITAVSPHVARYAERVSRRPVTVIPNCVSDDLANRAVAYSEPPPPANGGQTVVSALSDAPLKNVHRAIEAFNRVRLKQSDAEYHLVGPGLDAGGDVARWAEAQNLADGIVFHGPLPHEEFIEVASRSACLFHPSLEESFGLPLIEGMALGKTVIAGKETGGCPWVVDEGRAGLLVDVHSPAAMADQLTDVLARPEAYASQREKGLELVATRYSPTAVSDAYEAMYAQVLESVR